MDKLNSLQIFCVVAEQGSFANAAKAVGSDPSTISKAIQRLETSLGVQLVQRTTRQIKITQAGQQYLEHVRSMLENLAAHEEEIKAETEEPRGLLKINLPVSYGRLYVQPLIPEFCARYPSLDIEVNYDDAYVDIIEHGYDVSVRSGTLQDKRLVARQLSAMDFVTIAQPGFLAKYGIKRLTEQNATSLPWLRFRFKQSGKLMPIFSVENGVMQPWDVNEKYIVDDGEALAELCAAGLAITQAPHFIVRNVLQNKSVVPVDKPCTAPGGGVFVMYPKRKYLPARVRLFVEFLKEKIEQAGEGVNGTWALKLKVSS